MDPDFRHLLDVLSERIFWWFNRDKSKKTYDKWDAKVKNDPSRPEFASIHQLAETSKKTASREITKFNDKIEMVDKKARYALVSFVESVERRRSLGHQESSLQDGELGKRISEIEARLGTLESLKTNTNQTCTSDNPASRIASHYDLEIEELKNRVFEESKRNMALEEQVKALTTKLESMCEKDKRTDSQMNEIGEALTTLQQNGESISMKLEESIKSQEKQITNLVTQLGNDAKAHITQNDLDVALRKIENLRAEAMTAINSVRESLPEKRETEVEPSEDGPTIEEKLANFKSKFPSQDAMDQAFMQIAELKIEVDSHAAAMKDHTEESNRIPMRKDMAGDISRILTELDDLRKQTQDFKENMERSMSSQLGKLAKEIGERLKSAVDRFLVIVNLETEERGALTERTKSTESNLESIQSEMKGIKGNIDEIIKQAKAVSSQYDGKLATMHQRLTSEETQLQLVKAETKSTTDALLMQLQCLNAWQTQFTTKDLYKDIVKHINDTMPSGLTKQLRSALARLDALEKTVHNGSDELPYKKRKTQNGTNTTLHASS